LSILIHTHRQAKFSTQGLFPYLDTNDSISLPFLVIYFNLFLLTISIEKCQVIPLYTAIDERLDICDRTDCYSSEELAALQEKAQDFLM
jgi:hypothetical protein